MKKKIISLFMILTLVVTGAAFLTACGNKERNIEVGVSFKVTDWEKGYDYIENLNMSLDSHSFGGNFTDADTAGIPPAQTRADNTYVCTVQYKNGYNPASVTVTESSGKVFNKRVDGNCIYIEITPSENGNYEFTLSRPSVIVKKVGFTDISYDLLNSNTPVVKDFLDVAQIYVGDKFESVRKLIGLSLDVDMSQNVFYVYARFDTDAKRVKFGEDFKRAISVSDNYASSVDYEQIPGTTKYAYAYKFNTFYLQNSSEIKFDEGNIKYLTYRDCRVDTDFTVNAAENKVYGVQLKGYKIDDGEFQGFAAAQFTKEYGKAYTLRYKVEDTPLYNNDTKKEDIKFTVNGKQVATVYDGDANAYLITIGANTLPVDSYTSAPDITDRFKIGIDVKTIKPANGNSLSITSAIAPANEPYFIGGDGTKFAEKKSDDESYFMYSLSAPAAARVNYNLSYSAFRIKVTLNGTEYISDKLVAGTDYYVTDEAYADSGYKIYANSESTRTFLLGENTSSAKYIYVDIGGAFDVCVNNGNEQRTEIKIDVLEAEYRSAKIEFDSSVKGGKLILNNEEVKDNVIVANKIYVMQVGINDINDNLNVKFDLYSSDKLIGTVYTDLNASNGIDFTLSDELKNLGFRKSEYVFGMELFLNEGGGSEADGYYAKGNVGFNNGNPIWIEIKRDYTDDNGYEYTDSYYVMIDKIVVKL